MLERSFPQERHPSQRGYFAAELYEAMAKDESIWLVCADLGYKVLDHHFNDFPERTVNVGAAEQLMVTLACGLAQEGKRVFTYTIGSFYLRAAEPISLYVAQEQYPIIMVSSGRDADYHVDGISHDCTNAQEYMKMLGIRSYYPDKKEEMGMVVEEVLGLNKPCFISLRR